MAPPPDLGNGRNVGDASGQVRGVRATERTLVY
jgi:hypothetical protein